MEKDNNPTFRKEFDSWSSFVDYCQNQKTDMPMPTRESRFHSYGGETGYKQFTKAKNWEDVLKLAVDGWPEGMKQAKNISESLFDHVSSMIEKMDVNHDVEGHAIDVARFVDGEPECWLKFENVIQESENGHKLIKITYNCSVSAGVSTDVIIKKGAAIAALVELLEFAGHRVQVTLCDAVGTFEHIHNPGKLEPSISSFVKIKEFDQNLNMPLISYALAHPSVARALMFSFMETAPKVIRDRVGVTSYGGYGKPIDIMARDFGDIHIGESYLDQPQWSSEEETEKWIVAQLEKQGIHLKKEIK